MSFQYIINVTINEVICIYNTKIPFFILKDQIQEKVTYCYFVKQ